MESGQFLLDEIEAATVSRGYRQLARKIRILPATHGRRAAAIGAVGLIVHEILNLNVPVKPIRATRQAAQPVGV